MFTSYNRDQESQTLDHVRLWTQSKIGVQSYQTLYEQNIKSKLTIASQSKLILLSQPSLEYVGGLPLVSEFQIKTLATNPIIDFGMRNFIDQFIHLQSAFIKMDISEEEFKSEWKKILESAEEAYRAIRPLKFGQSEHMLFENGLFQVSVTPIRSGKVIGSCVWKISINTLNVLYITDYNLVKELHIDSLNVERLMVKNQKQSVLHREMVDLLIMENYPKDLQNVQQVNCNFFIKQTMEEYLNVYHKKQQGQLIFAFYPNERILEGIKSLHQIFKENEKFVGMKWDIQVHYFDLVEKARSFGEYLCWDNIPTPNQDNQSKIKSQIILTAFNNLFSGPFFQEKLLTDPNTTIVIFDRPPHLLNESMGKIRKSVDINLTLKESLSINLNKMRKLLLKNQNKLVINAPASTTYLPGSTTDLIDSQSVDQGIQKTDDQLSMMSEFKPIAEPLYDGNIHRTHPQLYYIESDHKESIQFVTAQLDKPLRPIQQLHLKEDYGAEIPKNLKQVKNKRRQQIETITQQMEEEQDAEIEKQKLQDTNFISPYLKSQSKVLTIQATVIVKNMPQNLKNAQMLLSQLNPNNILILNPVTKPRQSDCQLAIAKQNQTFSISQQNEGQNLPFVEIAEKQIEPKSAIQVKGKLELKISRQNQAISYLLKLTPIQIKRPICNNDIQLLALYEELKKRPDLRIELGFCQISLNNGQVIVSRTQQGFKVEGYFSNLYKEVRALIKTLKF